MLLPPSPPPFPSPLLSVVRGWGLEQALAKMLIGGCGLGQAPSKLWMGCWGLGQAPAKSYMVFGVVPWCDMVCVRVCVYVCVRTLCVCSHCQPPPPPSAWCEMLCGRRMLQLGTSTPKSAKGTP